MSLQVEVVSYAKDRLEVRLRGEGHTILNMLVDELNSDPRVTAAYRIEHPLVDVAYLFIATDGSKTPLDALTEAAVRLHEKIEAL
ncbi:MAG: RpoL/Rpb11 RNA polymerase subunit family protein, partial [Thermofilum sp.]